ncbi:unnamed protein product [Cuscuta epithymum]|uniref:FAS1 domain-containing protein n=1 Tax=Cuscuta epithymum TaxID=186058 RepID=A0AAV0FHI2_9ASTE|nr:unnamed protein product [Cuscuta epithymum]
MDFRGYGRLYKLFFFFSLVAVVLLHWGTATSSALPEEIPSKKNSVSRTISSNSVLLALLDSHYTDLSELMEKALLLQTLEHAVSLHNITIFAPTNEALERDLDPEFKRFLLEPRNLRPLQSVLLFHIIPTRLEAYKNFPAGGSLRRQTHSTLCREDGGENIFVTRREVSGVKIVRPDDAVRPDGVIHGIGRVLIPKSVQRDFNARRSLRAISAVLPTGAPEVDPRTHRLKKLAIPVHVGAPPTLPIQDAMAPGPSLAPAPAPGPGTHRRHFDGESQVKDFIQTLLHYGGYNELADILVNLTSLATEMGRLVSEGYVLTVLAPNDEAMAKLTADQLSEPGSPEKIMYYHIIPEYQTEESMYNAVRRFGKVRYDTLRLPHKVVAEEADGSVKFGDGEGSGYLFEPDIYTDGRISVQGIDGILIPAAEEEIVDKVAAPKSVRVDNINNKVVPKLRRGKLMEVACTMFGSLGLAAACS